MNRETVTLSQKELQRVEVISQCVQGNLACARAAELLDLSPRHVKRLKARYRQGSAAALAHASRGRPSHRRLPERVRQALLRLARTRYAGFNDRHLHQKLVEEEGFALSRETLRRLLRAAGIGPPRSRRPPAHRQRRLRAPREGELVQLDGSPHHWLEGRGPRLTALGMQDDASGKILAARFFLAETAEGYFHLLQSLLGRFGVPWLSMAIAVASSTATTIIGRSMSNSPDASNPHSSVAPSNNSPSPLSPRKVPRPKAASSVSGACCRTAW